VTKAAEPPWVFGRPEVLIMANPMLLKQARRRANAKIGFYIHAVIFTLVNMGLVGLNVAIGGFLWSLFPLVGWGIGLAFHAFGVFGFPGAAQLNQRMINAEMRNLENKSVAQS
jgi:2TM domain